MKFAMIYGDLRQKLLIELLADEGYELLIIGFENKFDHKNIKVCETYSEAIEGADVVIGPTPITKDGKNLFTIYDDLPNISIEEVIKASKGKIFISGIIKPWMRDLAHSYDIAIYDLLGSDDSAILNAIPTAEGVIQIAMQESDITLHGSNALVLGYGRCGKVLANILKGMGVNVTVCARKLSDIAFAKAYGYNAVKYAELKENCKNIDFIFNTIPTIVVDSKIIGGLKRSCIIIDLASAPGGTDFKAAEHRNIKALFCPSLPGRVAPRTVAATMKKAILDIIDEEGK
jgi:dipicolinate synthase subunit A